MSNFQVVLADPPWNYSDKLRMSDVARGSADQYETMSDVEIARLSTRIDVTNHAGNGKEIAHHIAGFRIKDDAVLFMWTTNSFLIDGTSAGLCRVWGFKPKQLITWVKTKAEHISGVENLVDSFLGPYDSKAITMDSLQFGMGHYTRGVTEHLILATKGKCTKLVKAKNIRNAFFAPRRKHSQKPDEQYAIIESLFDGPYLELFAREQREGWTAWGQELKS